MLTHTHFAQLLPLFTQERAAGRGVVLATIVRTAGSTYRKPGAQMVIAHNGEYAGLLSGGCLEGDLREHAQTVLSTRVARIVQYDMRSADDQLFGLGAGCEGAMDILLQVVGSENHWQPLDELHRHWQGNRVGRIGLIVSPTSNHIGGVMLSDGQYLGNDALPAEVLKPLQQAMRAAGTDNSMLNVAQMEVFVLNNPPPPRVLILGAGPDAQPLAQLVHFLGWKATVYDHRSAYTTRTRFEHAEQIVNARPDQLRTQLQLNDYHAIVVMSHHLDSDLHYLHQVAHSSVPYIGLLGPAARREKLFADLGVDFDKLRARLHAPIGLPIGASTPEAIALAIVTEIHAVLAQHSA